MLPPPNPPNGWTDGPGGAPAPPRTPPIASAFGDTDGEIFGQKVFPRKLFRSKTFRATKFSDENFSVEKQIQPKTFSAEKFAVRIAEGGNDGGGPGGAEAPPGPSVKSLPPRM